MTDEASAPEIRPAPHIYFGAGTGQGCGYEENGHVCRKAKSDPVHAPAAPKHEFEAAWRGSTPTGSCGHITKVSETEGHFCGRHAEHEVHATREAHEPHAYLGPDNGSACSYPDGWYGLCGKPRSAEVHSTTELHHAARLLRERIFGSERVRHEPDAALVVRTATHPRALPIKRPDTPYVVPLWAWALILEHADEYGGEDVIRQYVQPSAYKDGQP